MRKVLLIIFGILIGLVGLGCLLSGIGMFTSVGSDGVFESGNGRLKTSGNAIVVKKSELNQASISLFGRQLFELRGSQLKISATNRDTTKDVFVGIGPEVDVQKYLAGVAHDVTAVNLRDYHVVTVNVPGTNQPTPPAQEKLVWDEQASGPKTQTITWDVVGGDYQAVIMNADGSAPADVRAQFGVKVGWAFPVGIGLAGVGAVLLLVAISMLVAASNATAKQPTVTAVPAPPPLPKPMGGAAGPTP